MATRPSSVVPMFVRAEYQANQTFQRFESDAQRSANRVKQEYQAVGQIIDQALSVERTSAGGLDLGVDELREAAAAQNQRAIAAREVADAALRAAQADGVFNAEMREGVTAARQYATQQEQVAASLRSQLTVQEAVQAELNQTESAVEGVIAAQRRGTTANQNVINSQRAVRTANVQAGQQLQDIIVQLDAGTRATTIFAQQVPQLAFALSGLERSANATQARIGRFATFLSGPWGAAIFASTAVLGPFVAKLFESGEAADEATRAQQILTGEIDFARFSYEELTAAINDYNTASEDARQTTLLKAQATFLEAEANLQSAITKREQIAAELALQSAREFDGSEADPGGFVTSAQAVRVGAIESRAARNDALISDLERRLGNASFDLATEQAAVQSDQARAIAESYANARLEVERTVEGVEAQREAIIRLNREEQAAVEALRERGGSSRSGDAGARRRARELDRLREFAADAAREIAEIDNRFVQIPPSVALVNRNIQELDDLIAELEDRQPPNFEQLARDARSVRDDLADNGLQDLINQDLSQLEAQMAQQLQTQRLILGGRQDEADALAIINRLQRQHGDLSEETADRIRDMVSAYADAQLELEHLQERQSAFLGATRDLRQEIEGLLAGEGVDFERVFNQLRARLQFQELFGDSFRELEQSIYRDFETAVDDLSEETLRGSNALERYTDTLLTQASRLANGVPPTTAAPSDAFTGALASFGAPNSILGGANDNDIIVDGYRDAARGTVAGTSFDEFIDRSASATVDPLLADLPPEIAEALRPVLTGALGGLLRAGPVGAGIGLLQGLDISEAFNADLARALEGAQSGALANNLLRSVGVGGSSTGATLGGAAGALTGIPGGSIIGSIAGSLLGSVFGGSSRGSATIGGSGSSLDLTGVRGNSSREAGAIDLAESVLQSIERIADQLDATVNASVGAVSIGTRGDTFRVDPNGTGRTRQSNGAISFDDAESAVAFAVQDLLGDGVLVLQAQEQRLFNAAATVEQGIDDVLRFRSILDRTGVSGSPLEQEIIALNREFEDFIDLFDRANASVEQRQQLEAAYEAERAALIEEATDQVAGSLRDLIGDLTTGDNGLSLRSRRQTALGEFEDLRARVEAGDTSAFDDFEASARTLLDIERQIFGSQQSYFDRLEEVLAISRQAVSEQEAALTEAANTGSPFGGPVPEPIGIPIAEQTETLAARLDAVNDNIGLTNELLRSLSSSAGGSGRSLFTEALNY